MRLFVVTGVLAILGSAAQAAAPKYFINADVVRGAPGAQGAVCVQNSVFYPGEAVVWRVKVFETATGKALTEAQVKSAGVVVTVKLDNGVSKELHFSMHPPDSKTGDSFFAGGWQTTEKTPTGTLKWTASVKDKAGNTATFTPIGQDVGLAVLTIAAKVTPKK